MKIALCFSGGIRNFQDNFQSIYNNLILPLNPDIFIHGWYFKIDQIHNKHKIYTGTETPQDTVLQLLKPTSYKFETYDKHKEDELSNRFKIKQIQNFYKDNPRLIELYPNTVGMFWSIYQSNLLKSNYEKTHNFKYDIVIRCRPDFIYYTKLNIHTLKLVQKNTLLFPLDNYAFVTQMCDKFAIGSSHDMDIYSELILYMNIYIDKYPKYFWDGPSILKKHLQDFNINIKWIFFDYDYHIRKKSQRLTKDKLSQISYSQNLFIMIPKKYNLHFINE